MKEQGFEGSHQVETLTLSNLMLGEPIGLII
jgi:hypothetical protein